MPTATASEVQKNFGRYHDKALSEPVRVTKHGRETVYIVPAEMFRRLKQFERESLSAADLTDAEMTAIEMARVPAKHRYSLKDLK